MVDRTLILNTIASIRKRPRKDGTITWAVLLRDTDTGKQTSRSLATEAGAKTLKDFLDANNNSFALAAETASRLNSKSPTVQQVVTDHIETLTSASPGTHRTYRGEESIHIYPALGAIPVDRLTRAEVARWFNELPVAAKSKKNIHTILSTALKTAVTDGLITDNVALSMRAAAESNTFEPVFLSEAQMTILYSALHSSGSSSWRSWRTRACAMVKQPRFVGRIWRARTAVYCCESLVLGSVVMMASTSAHLRQRSLGALLPCRYG